MRNVVILQTFQLYICTIFFHLSRFDINIGNIYILTFQLIFNF
jgi:hypothetical protein